MKVEMPSTPPTRSRSSIRTETAPASTDPETPRQPGSALKPRETRSARSKTCSASSKKKPRRRHSGGNPDPGGGADHRRDSVFQSVERERGSTIPPYQLILLSASRRHRWNHPGRTVPSASTPTPTASIVWHALTFRRATRCRHEKLSNWHDKGFPCTVTRSSN